MTRHEAFIEKSWRDSGLTPLLVARLRTWASPEKPEHQASLMGGRSGDPAELKSKPLPPSVLALIRILRPPASPVTA